MTRARMELPKMTEQRLREVLITQDSLLESAQPYLSGSELDSLRCVTRLVVEFNHYLQDTAVVPANADATRYTGDSVFSGMDSFCALSFAVSSRAGFGTSAVDWNRLVSPSRLRADFVERYPELRRSLPFLARCRIVLDLFKLAVVLVTISYGE
jgi:hypothetical protein